MAMTVQLGQISPLLANKSQWVSHALIVHSLGFQHASHRCYCNALHVMIRTKKLFRSKLWNEPLSITRQKMKRKRPVLFFINFTEDSCYFPVPTTDMFFS